MALKKTVKSNFGIVVEGAYHRVENLSIVAKDTMVFQVRSRADKDQPMVFGETLYECSYDMNGANPIAQAYAYIKSLPEFADAVDC